MIIRLHNLSARAPAMGDLHAVAELFRFCDHGEPGDTCEDDLRRIWHMPSFVLKTDAWVIVGDKSQIVGYADVQCKSQQGEFGLSLCVHPDYLDRGLGTLLIWLAEERARQLMRSVPAEMDVMLVSHVSSLDQWACAMFAREGYTLTRRFWRLVIAMEEVSAQSLAAGSQRGQLTVDVILDTDGAMGDAQDSTNMYTAFQYEIHTKLLRKGRRCEEEKILVVQCAAV